MTFSRDDVSKDVKWFFSDSFLGLTRGSFFLKSLHLQVLLSSRFSVCYAYIVGGFLLAQRNQDEYHLRKKRLNSEFSRLSGSGFDSTSIASSEWLFGSRPRNKNNRAMQLRGFSHFALLHRSRVFLGQNVRFKMSHWLNFPFSVDFSSS